MIFSRLSLLTATSLLLSGIHGSGPLGAVAEDASKNPELTSSAYLALLPDGETKRRFIIDCAGCHQLDEMILYPEGSSRTHESWVESVEYMLGFAGSNSGFPIISPSRNPTETADWLTGLLPDGPPEPVAPPAAPEGYTITEYDLPKAMELPHDLAVDSLGRVIITGMLSHVMYALDPSDGAIEEIPIPVPNANPRAVESGEDGTWWVVLGAPNQLASYHPMTDEWQTWDLGMYPHEVAPDADGRFWFNGHFTREPELIGYVDPATSEVRTFVVPVPAMPDGGSTIPYGLRAAPDGTIWMTELVGGRLVGFDPTSEEFSIHELPTSYSGPRRLDIDDSGTIWIPEFANNRLARFEPGTGTFTEFELPTPDALPYVARVDPSSGVVWVGTAGADLIARFDPRTETFTEIRLPSENALIRHLAVDPRSGDVWGAYGAFPPTAVKVVRIQTR